MQQVISDDRAGLAATGRTTCARPELVRAHASVGPRAQMGCPVFWVNGDERLCVGKTIVGGAADANVTAVRQACIGGVAHRCEPIVVVGHTANSRFQY